MARDERLDRLDGGGVSAHRHGGQAQRGSDAHLRDAAQAVQGDGRLRPEVTVMSGRCSAWLRYTHTWS